MATRDFDIKIRHEIDPFGELVLEVKGVFEWVRRGRNGFLIASFAAKSVMYKETDLTGCKEMVFIALKIESELIQLCEQAYG